VNNSLTPLQFHRRDHGSLTIKDLHTDQYQSQTRNKLIAEAFYLTRDIEKYGSGYIRIRKEIKAYSTMQFHYQEMANGFLTELSYTEQKISIISPNKVGEKVSEKTTPNQLLMLDFMSQNPSITAREMSEKIGISARKIEENLKKLKQAGLIKRIGADKGRCWQINN
jgi:ATP-dependent DNA helicase RecG